MQRPTQEEQTIAWDLWNREHREGMEMNVFSRVTGVFVAGRAIQRIHEIGGFSKIWGAKILEIGCSSGWMSEILSRLGNVTATDLPSLCMDENVKRFPDIRFVPGDFMTLDFGEQRFDIIASLQTFPHIVDQDGFAKKVASLLKPHGQFIMTCQSDYGFSRTSWVEPSPFGQVRKWPRAHELNGFFGRHFKEVDIGSLLPEANQGLQRIVNAPKLNWLPKKIFGAKRVDKVKEWLGFGLFHTLVAEGVR